MSVAINFFLMKQEELWYHFGERSVTIVERADFNDVETRLDKLTQIVNTLSQQQQTSLTSPSKINERKFMFTLANDFIKHKYSTVLANHTLSELSEIYRLPPENINECISWFVTEMAKKKQN